MTRTARSRPGEPDLKRHFSAEPLTADEVAKLIDGCSLTAPTGVRNRAMLTLMARSGLRISEVVGRPPGTYRASDRGQPPLRVSDLTLSTHSIRVRDVKTGGDQTRGFAPDATDALARWIDLRKQLGLSGNGTPLFCTLRGDPVSAGYVRDMMKRLAARAGLEKRVHPHGLRHSYASHLDEAGVRVSVISHLLGHESIATTNIYLRGLTNLDAIRELDNIVLPPIDTAGPA